MVFPRNCLHDSKATRVSRLRITFDTFEYSQVMLVLSRIMFRMQSLGRVICALEGGSIFSRPARECGDNRTIADLARYRKLFGQIIVRHMCATGELSKPRPSPG